MDILTAKIGANMAISELTESGQVGYVAPPALEKVFESTLPANGSTVSIAGPFTFMGENYNKFVTVTVDGKSYDCYVRIFNQGDDAEIQPVSGTMPCKITGVCNGNYTSTYAVVKNLKVRYKTAHDADGHVIVEQLGKPTTHPIDPKYLPIGAVPGIVDLRQINSSVLEALTESALSNGIAVGKSAYFPHFNETVGTIPNILLQMDANGSVVSIPAMTVPIPEGETDGQLSCSFILKLNNDYLDCKMHILYTIGSTNIGLRVLATPITV